MSTTNPLNLLLHEKRLLYVLVGIQFANVVDFMIMMPLGPMLSREMGINTAQFGALVSVYTLAGAVSGLLCALFIERFDRKRLLLTVFALFAGATLACAASPTYATLLTARALAGIFGGMLGAVVNTLVVDHIPHMRRGQAMGLLGMSFSLSTVLGVPLSLWLANHVAPLGWRAPFVALTALSIAFVYAAYRLLPPNKHAQSMPRDGLQINDQRMPTSQAEHLGLAISRISDCLFDKNQRTALLLTMAMVASSFMVIPFLTIYATQNAGLPESYLPLMYFLGGACTLFTSRALGRWADRSGKFKVFRMVALLATIPLVTITQLVVTPVALYLFVSTAFFILVNGRVVVGQALGSGAATQHTRGIFMSLSACAVNLSLGLSTLVGGLIISTNDAGQVVGFPILGYLSICFTLLAIYLASKIVVQG